MFRPRHVVPPRQWAFRIADILEAIAKIEKYTRGMDLASFAADDKTVDAVVRNLVVVGEAARHIPAEIEQAHPEVPWNEMRGIRNVVVHEYFGVSVPILWETVARDLRPLVEPLRRIIASGKG